MSGDEVTTDHLTAHFEGTTGESYTINLSELPDPPLVIVDLGCTRG